MTENTSKGKQQFCGKPPITITKPERGVGPSFHYGVVGSDGATEHHVAVSTESKSRAPRVPMSAERRAALRADTNPTLYELRNMRDTLIDVGASVQNGRGVIMELGNLICLHDTMQGKAPRTSYMRKCMMLARPRASPTDVEEVIRACRQQSPHAPTRRSIGEAIGFDADVWEAHDCPAYIWPLNRTPDWIDDALKLKRAIKKSESEKKCKGKNKKPRKVTKTEIADEKKISRSTLWRQERRENAAKEAAGQGANPAGETKSGNVVTENIVIT